MTKRSIESNQGLIEWYEALTFALAVIILVFTFGVRIVAVHGWSMVPTLDDGDRLLLSSTENTAQRGDVIVIDSYIPYGKPLVKRIIALPGDTVDIKEETGEVIINGEVQDEPYIAEPTTINGDIEYPYTVEEGKVFVMGDNRLHSTDSRFSVVGTVDQRDILGKVLFRIFPIQTIGAIS